MPGTSSSTVKAIPETLPSSEVLMSSRSRRFRVLTKVRVLLPFRMVMVWLAFFRCVVVRNGLCHPVGGSHLQPGDRKLSLGICGVRSQRAVPNARHMLL